MLRRFRIISTANEFIFHRHLTNRNAKQLKYLPSPDPVSKITGAKTQRTPTSVELNEETLELLQRLSLVGFDKEEVVKIVQEAITFADKIFEVETTKVKPLVSLLEDESVYLRRDVPELDATRDQILSNCKITQEHYFVAPIGNSEAKFAKPTPQSEEVSEN